MTCLYCQKRRAQVATALDQVKRQQFGQAAATGRKIITSLADDVARMASVRPPLRRSSPDRKD